MNKAAFLAILLLLAGSFLIFRSGSAGKAQNGSAGARQDPSVVPTPASTISIPYLRSKNIVGSNITIEEDLGVVSNYHEYIGSYLSEGNKIYGLLTVPEGDMPVGGFPAIVFNHGFIPPKEYVTTERYVAYVDALARNGFVVFKIDYRGNGNSQGDASGTYFSSAYTIDAISALKALQAFDKVNPKRIGMWGHSMAGNLVLRAMEVSPDIKAGVIWSGAVYSYRDFATYGIHDTSYIHRPFPNKSGPAEADREVSSEIQRIRSDPKSIDFSSPFWQSISLTSNLKYLNAPLQLNQAVDDPVVNIGYNRDLAAALKAAGKKYEFNELEGGGHNIESPYFEQAMAATVQFFKTNL